MGPLIKKSKQLLSSQQQKGSSLSLSENSHQKKEQLNALPARDRRRIKPSVENLPRQMVGMLNEADLDNFAADLLLEGANISRSQVHARVCGLIEHRLNGRFPKVKAYPFGSVVIGLGRNKGDLDVFVDTADYFVRRPNRRDMKNAIHLTQRILTNDAKWEGIEAVTHARTPILRAYCKSEQIDCDLSFSNGLSCRNTALIGYYINLQPVCRKLAAIIKYWFGKLQLGVNSYIISLMVIFYLQQHKLLPSLKYIQDCCAPYEIDGWNTGFAPVQLNQLNVPLATDLMKFLTGFFHYYGLMFDYEKHMVSILTGTPVDKRLFDHGKEDELPPEFARYRAYMASIDLDEADDVEDLFANHKPFVIQDPFELCHNVAKGIQTPRLQKIVNYMRQSYEILSKRLR